MGSASVFMSMWTELKVVVSKHTGGYQDCSRFCAIFVSVRLICIVKPGSIGMGQVQVSCSTSASQVWAGLHREYLFGEKYSDIYLGDAAVVLLSPSCGNTHKNTSAPFSISLERYLSRHYHSLCKHWVNSFFPSLYLVLLCMSSPGYHKIDLWGNNASAFISGNRYARV